MKTNQEEDKSLSFVKRWIKAFNRMFKLFGNGDINNNAEFVDNLLKEEQAKATTQEELETIEEKRKLIEELCEDVDFYYEKKAAAEKAANLDEWFKNEVNSFVHDTIPDANQEDVKEIEDTVSDSMEKEIELRAKMLASEFIDDENDYSKELPENNKRR